MACQGDLHRDLLGLISLREDELLCFLFPTNVRPLYHDHRLRVLVCQETLTVATILTHYMFESFLSFLSCFV